MRRWAVVVVVAALVAVAQPAAAADPGLELVGDNTTFGTGGGEPSPDTLTNMTVQGSGTSADVVGSSGGSVGPITGNSTYSTSGERGNILQPKTSISEISIELMDDATPTQFEVRDNSSGTTLGTSSISGGSATVSGLSISQGQDVRLIFDAGGSSYTVDRILGNGVAPRSSSAFDLYGTSGAGNPTTGKILITKRVTVSTTLSDGQTTRYVGANHSADAVRGGRVNISLSDATASVDWEAYSGGSWSTVASDSLSDGITTTTFGPVDGPVRADISTTATADSPTIEIHNESALFQAADPTGGNADPTGDINSYDGDVSLDVSDADFRLAQSDSVTVTADNSTGQIGQTTVTSNGTVTFPYDAAAGSNSLTWTLTDSYDGDQITISQSFSTPAELEVYNETSPSQLADDTTLQFRFFADGNQQVVSKSVSDGTVSLDGLPASDRFVVTVSDDNTKYHGRRIVIESLFDQQEIYLLPLGADSVTIEFFLQDFTGGTYPPEETQLTIEKPVEKDFNGDGNETTQYQTIFGDTFGAEGGFPAILEQGARYRLRVDNQDGNQRLLGSYTANADATETLQIKGLTLDPPESQPYQTNFTRAADDQTVTWKYSDPTTSTTNLSVSIYEAGNRSNRYYSDSVSGPIQDYSAYQIAVDNDSDVTVNWSAERNGAVIGQARQVGGGVGIQIPLDADWLGALGVLTVGFVASLAGERKAAYVAVSVVAVAGLLMALQAVTILVPLWWVAALIAVGKLLHERQQPG